MQLRGAVKAPRRLENETAIEERQLKVTRRTKSRAPRRYVDYNPKLPPAAFPTLERPRTSQEPDSRSISQDETTLCDDGRTSVARAHHPKSHNGIKMAELNLASIPTDSLENSIASNCDLNPIYQKNMMEMANAGKTTGMDEEMDDSDPGRQSDEVFDFDALSEAIPISNPNWGDLSPRIQVEIFDNFCNDHKPSVASQILGLTYAERYKTQVYMCQREKQINLENLQLQRMRDRQLTSLLSIDNSDPKYSQTPHNQNFHQTSRKYSRKLEEALKIDFFSCHAGELMNAQRFLDQRGLDVNYAGEWCNGISTWGNMECEHQTYEAKSDTEDQIAAQPRSSAACDSLEISPQKREYHMSRYPGRPKDLFMRQGDYKLLSEQLLMFHEENMEEDTYRKPLSGDFSLTKKAPKYRLNRVCESEHPFIEPLKLVKTSPPMIRWHYSKPPSKCYTPENPASQADRDCSTSTMSSFARLKQRLEKAKAELHQQPQLMEHSQAKSKLDSDDDRSSSRSLLVGQAIFSDDTCSRLASPSRVLREKSPEAIRPDSLFLMGDAENQRATSISSNESGIAVYAPTVAASNVSRSPSPSPSSLGFHDQSMATFMESSPDAKLADTAGGSDMDDDCDADVDEMVMVPTDPRKTVE